MYYTVNNLREGSKSIHKTLKLALAEAVEQEARLLEHGYSFVSYDMYPKVKKSDKAFGRVVYTTWRTDVWIPLLSVVEHEEPRDK